MTYGPAHTRPPLTPLVARVIVDLHELVIPGYAGGPYTHRLALLDSHLFWIAHLASFFHGRELEELLLGPDYAACEEFTHQIYEIADWPTFVIPLGGGRTVYVVCRTLVGDAALDLLICRSDWLSYRVLVSTDSLSTAPGLSWADLTEVGRNSIAGGSSSDPHERLLLLLPALAHGELPETAADTIAAALAACTAVDNPQAVASLLAAQRTE